MKTERRHDLETNLLAQKLAGWIKLVQPYSGAATVVAVAAAVVLVGWFFLGRQAAKADAEAWNAYFLATVDPNADPELLLTTAEKHSGSQVAYWANLTWADKQLLSGTQTLFIDKTRARGSLTTAVEAYRLLETSGAPELVRQRASFGLARAYESLGQVDLARKQYQKVHDQDDQGTFAALAKSRVDALDRPEIQEFYTWFASAEPPLPPMSGGLGIPGQRPLFNLEGGSFFDTGLLPDFGLGLDDELPPADVPPADVPPADVSPADGEEPATDPSEQPKGETQPDQSQ